MNKKIIILLISAISIFMILNSCTIITQRWALEFDLTTANPGYLEIHNSTGETISTIKYYVGDFAPSDWNSSSCISIGYALPYTSSLYQIGTNKQVNITAPGNSTVWIRVAADAAGQSQLYAQDGFVYKSGDNKWVVTVTKP